MRAFNVGVYSPSGQPILRGAERTDRDFFLYDFEIDLMARSLGRQLTWSLPQLAGTLTEMGIRPDDQPITAEDLRQALISSVLAASQKPNDRLSLFPLLLRELGLHQAQPYDMLNDVREDMQFDSLQACLILADTTIPFVQEAEPFASSVPNSQGIIMVSNPRANNPCKDIGKVAKEGWGFGKWAIRGWAKFVKVTKSAADIIDILHGVLLAASIKVSSVTSSVGPTHYGHEQPGKELTFGTRVEMLDALPDIVVDCGWLLG